MLNKSPQLKAERGYTDPQSFVRLDGSERLAGKDWEWRKSELWERSGGRCEQQVLAVRDSRNYILIPAHRCSEDADDPHHIKPRSKGRDDRLSNLQALCRYHHRLVDERKIGGRSHATPSTD